MFSRSTLVTVSAIALAVSASCGQAGLAHAGETAAQKEGNNLYTPDISFSKTRFAL
jgi:hypothetical protein